MKEFQTPHNVYYRATGNRSRRLNDFPKFTKKCLNAAFTSVFEDSVDFSTSSEISDANHNEDVTALSDTMLSKNITNKAGISSTSCFSAYELDSAMFTSLEAKVAANSLKNAEPEAVNSLSDAPQYKKLMEELTEYVMEDLYRNTQQEEDLDGFAQVLSAKNRKLFLCFCIWIVGVSAVLLFTSDIHCPSREPSPT